MDRDTAVNLIKKLTSYTKYYAVVNIVGSRQGVTRFANSEISQNINQYDIELSLTLYDGKKEATCETNVVDDSGLKKLVQDTEALLNATSEGEFEKFQWQHKPIPAFENDRSLETLYNVKGRVEVIKENVSRLDTNRLAAGALILEHKIIAYGNSGSKDNEILFFALDNVQFNTVVTDTATGADGGGECISHKSDSLDISAAFSQANERAEMGANPVTVEAKEHTVILSPQAVGDLIYFLKWSLNSKYVADGLSFCSGDLAKEEKAPSFGDNISIYDDVNDPRLFPWYFDYEGHKREALPLIEQGRVKNLLYDNKTALKMGGRPTGHAYSNKGLGGFSFHTVMQGGSSSVDEMIKNTEKGLFISEFHYTNFVNPRALLLTGLTRNGTFLIENGKITKPVTTMRFTQNLQEAFKNVTALSKEQHIVNSIGWASVMPAAKVEGFCFP